MKRRRFIKRSSGIAASLCLPAFSFAQSKSDKWRYSHNSTPLETTIQLDGINSPVSILQITDSHISCDDESDAKYKKYSDRMNKAYPLVKHFKTNEMVTPLDCFGEIMEMAAKEAPDLIALTGDIVNYPSETAIRAALKIVNETNIPYFYTAGNHDWHYEGMEGSSDYLRQQWIEARLSHFIRETLTWLPR